MVVSRPEFNRESGIRHGSSLLSLLFNFLLEMMMKIAAYEVQKNGSWGLKTSEAYRCLNTNVVVVLLEHNASRWLVDDMVRRYENPYKWTVSGKLN